MPRYSPLPSVSIDPRSEADLVQAAAQTVYEASNKTLNDFSAGNPLAVLLEGQAFAQGEFLYWANQALPWVALRSQSGLRIGYLAAVLLGSAVIYFSALLVSGLKWRALLKR